MQELIQQLNNSENKEKMNIYIKILKELGNKDLELYCILDPKRILEETSIPFVAKINNVKKVPIFSKKEYAVEWCEHYNIKYKGRPLIAKLLFSDFYKTIAIAAINDVSITTLDEGQNSLNIFIPDLFNANNINFTQNIIMPRMEINQF